jgi:hypothetical protein
MCGAAESKDRMQPSLSERDKRAAVVPLHESDMLPCCLGRRITPDAEVRRKGYTIVLRQLQAPSAKAAPHCEDVHGDLDAAALGSKLLVEGIVWLPQLALCISSPHALVVPRPDLTQSCK